MKTSFESDYNNGTHPAVLRRLTETNNLQSQSYGDDIWSKSARNKIREACGCPDADIFFLAGGTQTNAVVIDSLIYSYEGVIAVETGHINVHEAGAIELTGHKILTLPSHNGKMDAVELEGYLKKFFADPTFLHMVIPGMVYITYPTELGSIYSAAELEAIFNVCRKYHLSLYIDGARLGYGLMSYDCDITLPWLAKHCDAFYIGGTKVGSLCGEAVVFPHSNAPRHFFTYVKQHGALFAKSRLTGVQFDALFTDNLYFKISRHAIDMAMILRKMFTEAGIELYNSPTNQQFVVLTDDQMRKISTHVLFETWKPLDDTHTLCRFVTSWATTKADLEALSKALDTLQ